MKKITGVIFTGILLMGCKSTTVELEKDFSVRTEGVYKKFIQNQTLTQIDYLDNFRLRSSMVLDNQHIVIESHNRKKYLVNTTDACLNMIFADRLGLLVMEKNTLRTSSDKIIRVGTNHPPCTISKIYKLYEVQFEELSNLNSKIRWGKESGFKSSNNGYL